MKPHDHSLIAPHALAGVIAGAAVLAVALCSILFPRLPSFSMPLIPAGIVACIATGWLAAARKQALQQRLGRVCISIRRRD